MKLRVAPPDDRHQFLGIEIGKVAIENQSLPIATLQFVQRLSSAGCHLHRASRLIEQAQNAIAKLHAGRRDQYAT